MDYKENPDRSFYVSGQINEGMVKGLLPQINKLRVASNAPITVYIDSPGGDTHAADTIRSLATAPDANGVRRDLITVSIGTSASAAADMLAHGDYAIAYEHSLIIYHGTRQSPRASLTSEDATSLASSLQQTNEMYALRLARRAFKRLLFPLSQLKAFNEFQESTDPSIAKVTEEFASKLTPMNQKLVRQAQAKCAASSDLTTHIVKKLTKSGPQKSKYRFEKLILDAILEHKSKHHKNEAEWSLSEGGLDEVLNDFKLFHDFHFGLHNQEQASLMETFGGLLLSKAMYAEYEEFLATGPQSDAIFSWMHQRCGQRMQQLWYFAVSLARIMQTADFVLLPHEAFWLGLVDEVPGSGLISLRELQSMDASATEPPQPPSQSPAAVPESTSTP